METQGILEPLEQDLQTESPSTEEPISDTPAAPVAPAEPAAEEHVVDAAPWQTELATMRAELAAIKQQSAASQQNVAQQQAVKQVAKNFVTKDNWDNIFADPAAFDGMLQDLRVNIVEQVFREMPQIVGNLVYHNNNLSRLVEGFYKENPDLHQFDTFVATVAQDLQSKHPDWDYQKVLSEAGKESRRQLKLGLNKPRAVQVPGSGGRKPAPIAPTGLDKEIGELLELHPDIM